MKIKNIAIIAHVDHGKTTLVDQLLKSTETFRTNETVETCVMDSNDIERERGITILAKTTAVHYQDYKINILDTPGHADFSGEVERIMGMVDGVLLVVDAYEGTMPQTRFVLKKALEYHHKAIVVINKIDKPSARPAVVIDEVLDLFIDLGADDDQLEFPVVYASAVNGTCSLSEDPTSQEPGMIPLLDMILKEIPDPEYDNEAPLQFQPALLDYNDYVGRIGIGRIQRGTMRLNEMVSCIRVDGSIQKFRIQKLYSFLGLKKIEVETAQAGDIVAIAGLDDIYVGETVCKEGCEEALPLIRVSEPTVQMNFGTNTSPFSGKEGTHVTGRKIEDRLFRETQRDVSLKIERVDNKEEWIVSGRGELHLSILMENLRREGFEFQVSRPRVILKEIEGTTCEPYEYVQVDVPDEYVGAAIEMLGNRRGILENMHSQDGQTRLIYTIPSKGLIGFMTDFLTATHGYGIINHTFLDYRPIQPDVFTGRKLGVLVSINQGMATAYACGGVEDRGELLIEPGANVYEGMIVGICNREEDLAVNITREKQMTNQRSATKDTTVVLKKPRVFSLENYLSFIDDDELVEVTPKTIRLRKLILDTVERKKFDATKLKKH
ncbi:MAG: translational GTPase TypA [Prevotella sp.]|nr:translational GTPase TypA [Staphylococcus sp.]MCM1350648.1 translational GTPase TypA [Prevotella sp.]